MALLAWVSMMHLAVSIIGSPTYFVEENKIENAYQVQVSCTMYNLQDIMISASKFLLWPQVYKRQLSRSCFCQD